MLYRSIIRSEWVSEPFGEIEIRKYKITFARPEFTIQIGHRNYFYNYLFIYRLHSNNRYCIWLQMERQYQRMSHFYYTVIFETNRDCVNIFLYPRQSLLANWEKRNKLYNGQFQYLTTNLLALLLFKIL